MTAMPGAVFFYACMSQKLMQMRLDGMPWSGLYRALELLNASVRQNQLSSGILVTLRCCRGWTVRQMEHLVNLICWTSVSSARFILGASLDSRGPSAMQRPLELRRTYRQVMLYSHTLALLH